VAASLPRTITGKLKPRYVGPYRVTELINDVAVRLELPSGARLHDVFHVGVLRKYVGSPPTTPPALTPLLNGAVMPEPARIAGARLSRGVRQVLVHWSGEPASSATWEEFDDSRAQFPAFQLEDELAFDEGRDVMYGRSYARQCHACDRRRAQERADRQERDLGGRAVRQDPGYPQEHMESSG
jgi:hypothetical protein